MFTILKWLSGLLLTLCLLVLVAVLVLPRFIDPNDYRQTITELVKNKTGRDLELNGDLSISVFPWLGIKTEGLSFSQPDEIKGEMLKVKSAQLRVKLMPLFSKRLEVDTVVLEQPQIRLVTLKNGVSSFSSLLGEDDKPVEVSPSDDKGMALALVIQGLSISDGSIDWDNRQAGQYYQVSQLNFNSGNLIGDELADINVSGKLLDLAENSAQKKPLDFNLSALMRIDTQSLQVLGKELTAQLEQPHQQAVLEVGKLQIDQLAGMQAQLQGIKVTAKMQQQIANSNQKDNANQSALKNADISAKLDSLHYDIDKGDLSLQSLLADIDMALLEQPELQSKINIPDVAYNLDSGKLAINGLKLDGQFDQRKIASAIPKINANINEQIASVPAARIVSDDVSLDLRQLQILQFIDKPQASGVYTLAPFDLTKILADLEIDYLPANKSALRKLSSSANFKASMDAIDLRNLKLNIDDSALNGFLTVANFAKPSTRFDLSLNQLNLDDYLPESEDDAAFLEEISGGEALSVPMSLFKEIDANGHFKANQLIASKVVLRDVDVDIKSTSGRVEVTPRAELYNGKLLGKMIYSENNGQAKLEVKNKIDLVNLQDFLSAIEVTQQLSGIGSLDLNLTVTEKNGVQNNHGEIKLLAKNGAIKGVDIKKVVDKAYYRYQQLKGDEPEQQQGASEENDETRFAELFGSFKLDNFKLSNRDFVLKAPLFRVGGNGDIDLAKQVLDYTVDFSVVSSTDGQGGEPLEKLKGITLPIRFTGDLTSPRYSLDMQALYKALAQEKVEEKKAELIAEKLGIEDSQELSTKEILQQVLVNKANEKLAGKHQKEKESEPSQAPASQEQQSSKTDKQAEAETDEQPWPEEGKSDKEQLKDELKKKLLEKLFN